MLDVSHFDISGKNNKEEQFEKICEIFVTLDIFHLAILGKEINKEQE